MTQERCDMSEEKYAACKGVVTAAGDAGRSNFGAGSWGRARIDLGLPSLQLCDWLGDAFWRLHGVDELKAQRADGEAISSLWLGRSWWLSADLLCDGRHRVLIGRLAESMQGTKACSLQRPASSPQGGRALSDWNWTYCNQLGVINSTILDLDSTKPQPTCMSVI
ncbi:hypothetical protein CFAM422_006510 [Trichoderma lentiforme]|uniref:Uncharacterized protein n=1 Tax=Trichoderma lentiforme TaxID=1567552 RepID=A0A9P4XFK0_9HYPO|nr:hypothetical protein CFAM422_006510 [Trichoderma lentiforme]